MTKPLIFISHITSEKEIALALKEIVNDAFLGMADVFVSSDPDSIAMGGKWLEKITDALKTCVVEIVLTSPASIKKPWINFEAGAGWVRDIPVIPLCHSGMTFESLPSPLSSLQGGISTDSNSMGNVFNLLANAIGSNPPETNFHRFIEIVKKFEETSYQLVNQTEIVDIEDDTKLSKLEVDTLIAIAESSGIVGEAADPDHVVERMQKNKAGYRPIAVNLGVESLKRRGLIYISYQDNSDFGGYAVVSLHTNGWMWLTENQDMIEMTEPDRLPPIPSYRDDIPF